MFKFAQNIRILPVVIFLSVLTMTIRVNNIVETVKEDKLPDLSFGSLQAAETPTPEAEGLSAVLASSDFKDTGTQTQDGEQSPNNFTQSEILILQELAERREALDLRSNEIDKRAIQLKVAEKEIDKRLKQMKEYEEKLKLLINEYNEKEKEKIASLVKVYANMKPKEAARIFETLDLEVTVSLLKEMKPSTSSAILAQISPTKAKAITDKIIGNAF